MRENVVKEMLTLKKMYRDALADKFLAIYKVNATKKKISDKEKTLTPDERKAINGHNS